MITTIIVISISIIICFFLLKDQIKHIKGEGGGCCGETAKVPPKKLKNKILGRKKVYVLGMHCKNCENKVTFAINSIEGAAAIKVSASKNSAILEYDREISNEVLKNSIEEENFTVSSIKDI